jgi:hypothetical protein
MATGTYQYQSDFAMYEAHGKASAVLILLDARGVVVSEEQRWRILDCTDRKVLDRWIEKAVTLTSADELFTE